MTKYTAPHPGGLLKHYFLPNLNLTQTEAARALRVNRVTFCNICNGDAAISPQMAVKLELWLGVLPASAWLAMQASYELGRVDTAALKAKVKPLGRPVTLPPPHEEAGYTPLMAQDRLI